MNWPSLSIIIPSYNQGAYIERTLLSILKQDYPGELQIVVSDGGSTDETIEVLKRYPQVEWWSERDKGFVDAVTKALKVVRGEILAIQSSDDYYLEDAFAKVMAVFDQDPDVSLVSGAEIRLESDGIQHYAGPAQDLTLNSPHLYLMRHAPLIAQHCAFVRRNAVEAVGGLREEVDRCADFDLWYRVLHLYKAHIIPDYVGVCQVHGGQRTQASANLWIDSLKRVVESCESSPRYSSHFQVTADEKREVYRRWDIHWLKAAGGPEEEQRSQQLALDVTTHPEEWPPTLVAFAQSYLPSTEESSPSLLRAGARKIKDNPMLRSLFGKEAKPLALSPPALASSTQQFLTWWEKADAPSASASTVSNHAV